MNGVLDATPDAPRFSWYSDGMSCDGGRTYLGHSHEFVAASDYDSILAENARLRARIARLEENPRAAQGDDFDTKAHPA